MVENTISNKILVTHQFRQKAKLPIKCKLCGKTVKQAINHIWKHHFDVWKETREPILTIPDLYFVSEYA